MSRLVMTVGGSPLPLLRTLLVLRPDRLVALTTTESAPVLDRLITVLRELDPGAVPNLQGLTVPAHDLPGLERACAGVLHEAPADVCYAGGTWAMSAALMRAFLSSGGAGTAWYVADDGDLLIGHRGKTLDTRPAMETTPLDLRQMLALHGALPQRWRDNEPIPPAPDAARLYRQLQSLPKAVEGAQAAASGKAVTSAVLTAVATLVGDQGTVYPESRIALRAGGREREQVLPPTLVSRGRLTVLSIPGFTRAKHPRGPRTFDRSTGLGTLKESLYAAHFLATRGGGAHARAGSITTDPGGDGGASRLRQDLGPDTVPDVIDPADPTRRVEPHPRIASFSLKDLYEGVANVAIDVGLAAGITEWLLGAPR
jgi:hypothetical protein